MQKELADHEFIHPVYALVRCIRGLGAFVHAVHVAYISLARISALVDKFHRNPDLLHTEAVGGQVPVLHILIVSPACIQRIGGVVPSVALINPALGLIGGPHPPGGLLGRNIVRLVIIDIVQRRRFLPGAGSRIPARGGILQGLDLHLQVGLYPLGVKVALVMAVITAHGLLIAAERPELLIGTHFQLIPVVLILGRIQCCIRLCCRENIIPVAVGYVIDPGLDLSIVHNGFRTLKPVIVRIVAALPAVIPAPLGMILMIHIVDNIADISEEIEVRLGIAALVLLGSHSVVLVGLIPVARQVPHLELHLGGILILSEGNNVVSRQILHNRFQAVPVDLIPGSLAVDMFVRVLIAEQHLAQIGLVGLGSVKLIPLDIDHPIPGRSLLGLHIPGVRIRLVGGKSHLHVSHIVRNGGIRLHIAAEEALVPAVRPGNLRQGVLHGDAVHMGEEAVPLVVEMGFIIM